MFKYNADYNMYYLELVLKSLKAQSKLSFLSNSL